MPGEFNAQIIDQEFEYYFERIQQGKSSIGDARKEMEAKGIEQQNVDFVIRQLSRDLQRQTQHVEKANYALWGFWGSMIVFAGGTGITAYTYMTWEGGFVLAYGAIGSGLAGMVGSLTIYNSSKSLQKKK